LITSIDLPRWLRITSPGFIAAPGDQVLAGGHDADDVRLHAQLADRLHGAQHRGAPAHVELHLLHRLRRLDGDAARVEGEALAHEHERLGVRRPAPVLQHEEARLLLRALRHGEQRPHPLGLQLGGPEDGRLMPCSAAIRSAVSAR
jgi:hypothetical protein